MPCKCTLGRSGPDTSHFACSARGGDRRMRLLDAGYWAYFQHSRSGLPNRRRTRRELEALCGERNVGNVNVRSASAVPVAPSCYAMIPRCDS